MERRNEPAVVMEDFLGVLTYLQLIERIVAENQVLLVRGCSHCCDMVSGDFSVVFGEFFQAD